MQPATHRRAQLSIPFFAELQDKVPGIKIGVQLASFGKPFKQAVQEAAALGVDSIEIDARHDLRPSDLTGTALRQIRKLLADRNLRVVAVRFQTRRGYDCEEDLDRRVVATKQAIQMANGLGAPVLVNQVGFIPETDEAPSLSLLRDVVFDLGRFAQHQGVLLGCESGSEPLTRLAQFIESMPDGAIAMTLNPGNLIVNGLDLEDLPRVIRHICMVHAKDAVKDRARGRGMEVPLGRGLAEFPTIVAALAERHFQGAFVIDREPSPSATMELATSIEFLQNIGA